MFAGTIMGFRSRNYFNRVGEYAENPGKTNYSSYFVSATHAAMGGDPWTGDGPPFFTRRNDNEMTPIIDQYVRRGAIAAFVPIRYREASEYGYW